MSTSGTRIQHLNIPIAGTSSASSCFSSRRSSKAALSHSFKLSANIKVPERTGGISNAKRVNSMTKDQFRNFWTWDVYRTELKNNLSKMVRVSKSAFGWLDSLSGIVVASANALNGFPTFHHLVEGVCGLFDRDALGTIGIYSCQPQSKLRRRWTFFDQLRLPVCTYWRRIKMHQMGECWADRVLIRRIMVRIAVQRSLPLIVDKRKTSEHSLLIRVGPVIV